MRRARLWAEVPNVESALREALREGDMARVYDIAPPSKHASLPEPRACDDFVLDLYSEMRVGGGFELVRWRCSLEGLSDVQALEVWRRVCGTHYEIADYYEQLRKAVANG